jgi:hypothetical protein
MNIKEASVPTEEDRAYSKANHLRNLLNYQNGAVINQLTYVGWGVGGGVRCSFSSHYVQYKIGSQTSLIKCAHSVIIFSQSALERTSFKKVI